MSKKALFTDLDGTLLNQYKQITEKNRKAIDRMLKEQHMVIITTGRPTKSAIKQAKKLSLDKPGCYLIAYNGGVIYDFETHAPVFSSMLPRDYVLELYREAAARNIHIQAYSKGSVIVDARCDDENVRQYCTLCDIGFEVVDSIEDFTEDTVKLLCSNYEDNTELKAFQKYINSNYAGKLYAFFSCKEYLEIVNFGLSKGDALLRLCDLLSLPVENTVSCGDEGNDISMIKAAHIGCAMKNAIPDCIKAADYVTERDNNHDGVAEIIERFILE